ncbi:unnamed protein product [Oreochromis niloticus]|nr:unnamed protein product [Mustela putorius furo]
MEVRALCIRLLVTVLILLCAHAQKVDAVSLLVVPNRLQFFEYESLTFHCEGVDYCEVVYKVKGKIKSCNKTNEATPTGSSCTIKNFYTDDSGEYWYETGGGTRSNIINLSVTAGPVILESPAVPVLMEETVTLSCRNKTASSNFTAEFYKDGRQIHRSSTGNIAIHRVSKSDEGLYKCSISGVGESPESWLKVTDMTHSSSAATPWIIATILVSALLVAVGLYHFRKGCWKREAGTVDAGRATYAFVRKNRKTGDEVASPSRPIYYSLGHGDTQLQESGTSTEMPSAGPCKPIAEDPFYSAVQ